MNLSESKEVQDFLEEILATDEEKSSILKELREMVFTNFEETNEKIMYGGIMFSNQRDENWGGVFAYKNHVSFEFTEGFKLQDPNNILDGAGKKRRHIKIKSLADIEEKKVESFIKETICSSNNT
jgi:uncharacterized protein YdeI (YjbR/CyaY-like superfamily)